MIVAVSFVFYFIFLFSLLSLLHGKPLTTDRVELLHFFVFDKKMHGKWIIRYVNVFNFNFQAKDFAIIFIPVLLLPVLIELFFAFFWWYPFVQFRFLILSILFHKYQYYLTFCFTSYLFELCVGCKLRYVPQNRQFSK